MKRNKIIQKVVNSYDLIRQNNYGSTEDISIVSIAKLLDLDAQAIVNNYFKLSNKEIRDIDDYFINYFELYCLDKKDYSITIWLTYKFSASNLLQFEEKPNTDLATLEYNVNNYNLTLA